MNIKNKRLFKILKRITKLDDEYCKSLYYKMTENCNDTEKLTNDYLLSLKYDGYLTLHELNYWLYSSDEINIIDLKGNDFKKIDLSNYSIDSKFIEDMINQGYVKGNIGEYLDTESLPTVGEDDILLHPLLLEENQVNGNEVFKS